MEERVFSDTTSERVENNLSSSVTAAVGVYNGTSLVAGFSGGGEQGGLFVPSTESGFTPRDGL